MKKYWIFFFMGLVSCSTSESKLKPEQDILIFRNSDGVYLNKLATASNKKQSRDILIAKLEGEFVTEFYKQEGNKLTYATVSSPEPNTKILQISEITTPKLQNCVLEKRVYKKADSQKTNLDIYKSDEKGTLYPIASRTIDQPFYVNPFILYQSEKEEKEKKADLFSYAPFFNTTQQGTTQIINEKGTLYIINDQKEKEILFEHKGGFNLKFGGGCYHIAIAPSEQFAIFSYRHTPMSWNGEGELHKINLKTKESTLLIKEGIFINPDISNDGKHLLYSDKKNIYILNLDTKQKKKVGKGTHAKWI